MMGRPVTWDFVSTAFTDAKSNPHAGRSFTFASAHSRSRITRSILDSRSLPARDTSIREIGPRGTDPCRVAPLNGRVH
jgi:hypothetical protein